MRPGTPDAAAEVYGSQASLSASEDPSSSPELRDTADDSAIFLSATSGDPCASDLASDAGEMKQDIEPEFADLRNVVRPALLSSTHDKLF